MANRIPLNLSRVAQNEYQDSDTGSFIRMEIDKCSALPQPMNGEAPIGMRRVTMSFAINVCLDNGQRLPILRGSLKVEAWTGGDLPIGPARVVDKAPITLFGNGTVQFNNTDIVDTLDTMISSYMSQFDIGKACTL